MPALPNIGDLIGDKYEVVRVLGQGGMGAVFEGVHRLTGKRFAIKWMLPSISGSADAIKRFIREAQVAGRVEHPNVVEVYDLGQQDGSCYMVMELLQGESMRELLERRGRLDETSAAQLLIPVLRGLASAHAAGVIHRDLKPENIFLAQDQTGAVIPKVLDFGISKLSSASGQVTVGLTRLGQVMGTPHYMPPEQLRGETVDHRVDVYAMGVILYQAVSGQLPFPSDTFGELVIQIATTTAPPLAGRSGVSAEFASLVERAMARSAGDRFQSAAELALALEAFGGGVRFNAGMSDPFGISAGRGGSDTVALPTAPTAPRLAVHASQTPLSAESTWDRKPAKPGVPRALFALVLLLAAAVGSLIVLALSAREEASWAAPATAAQAEANNDTNSALDDGSHAAPSPAKKEQVELIPLDLTREGTRLPMGTQPPTAELPEPRLPAAPSKSEGDMDKRRDADAERQRTEARRVKPRKRRPALRRLPPAPDPVSTPLPAASQPPPPEVPDTPKPGGRAGRIGVGLSLDDF